jgi:hypothetical protein
MMSLIAPAAFPSPQKHISPPQLISATAEPQPHRNLSTPSHTYFASHKEVSHGRMDLHLINIVILYEVSIGE